jgi:hypothetical protein
MTNNYPYHPSPGAIRRVIEQLRSAFPTTVNADTLKKWGIAPKNESVLLNVIKYLKLVDSEGNKLPENAKIFLNHDDSEFELAFSGVVKSAYEDLFSTFGDTAWGLEKDKLIGYFRTSNGSSDNVGQLQASTFQALAGLSGKVSVQQAVAKPIKVKSVAAAKNKQKKVVVLPAPIEDEKIQTGNKGVSPNTSGMALTVRVEINLPVADDQAVYDRIFKSIKENLMNG